MKKKTRKKTYSKTDLVIGTIATVLVVINSVLIYVWLSVQAWSWLL